MEDPKVAVVVLNWNGWRDSVECGNSLLQLSYARSTIIVVDNGSTDGSVERLRAALPGVDLIETGRNLGFAGGNNVGIRRALERGAEFVLLLNNDTTVAPDLLEALLAGQRAQPSAGVLGPKTYYHGDPGRLWYAGGYWDDARQCFGQRGEGEPDCGQYDTPGETDFVVGSAMFVPRAVFERVGLLREDYFLNYEEIDFCTRVRAAGYTLGYVPAARVWHKVSASFGGEDSPMKLYFTFRNRLLWAERHLPPVARARIAASVAANLGRRFALPLLRPQLEHWSPRGHLWAVRGAWRSPLNQAVALGVGDYLRRRFGPFPDAVRELNHRWRNRAAATRADA